eukprot:m.28032 g.28032  ORF g.28032 m.28032 type:complete len:362 (+) comp30535_c1_seq1:33-1118(+)
MDALGFDVYGFHEGRDDMVSSSSQDTEREGLKISERFTSLRNSLTSSASAAAADSTQSTSSIRNFYSSAIGTNDFHLYNPDASGFDDEEGTSSSSSSSESSSRAETEAVHLSTANYKSDSEWTTNDSSQTAKPDEHRNEWDWDSDLLTKLQEKNVSSSSSGGSTAEEADRNFMSGAEVVVAATEEEETLKNVDMVRVKRAAVLGRDFDEPQKIARLLQKGCGEEIRFIPLAIRRHELLSLECLQYIQGKSFDVIILCYNTSEARILLTGTDGFYTTILEYTNYALGESNVLFVLTRCSTGDNTVIEPNMRQRIYQQAAMRPFLDSDQVFSWHIEPSKRQRDSIKCKILHSQKPEAPSCVIL